MKRQSASVLSVIDAVIGRHSAKPAEVRDRIVRLMGDVPRIELFARERAQGWEAWGNEVEANKEFSPSLTVSPKDMKDEEEGGIE
jgi:site-specific DNA-methyltransferase (adenine-specific)